MLRRRLTHFGLLFGALALSGSALATSLAEYDKLVEERRQLDLQETNVRKRLAFLNELDKVLGRFKQLEDERVLGEKGLRIQVAEFSAKLQGWLKKWAVVQPLIHNLSGPNISGQADVISGHLNELSKELVTLTSQSITLFGAVRDTRAELADIGEMSAQFYQQPDIVPDAVKVQFSERIHTFNGRVAGMNQYLTTTLQELDQNRTQRYAEIISLYQQAIDLRLKEIALNNPALQEAVNAAGQAIALVTEYEGRVTRLEDQKLNLISMIGKKHYFHSEKMYAEFDEISNALHAEIDNLKAPDTLKGIYKGRIKMARSEASQRFTTFKSAYLNPNTALSQLLTQRTAVFNVRCKNEKLAAQYDCELGRLLIAVQKSNPNFDTWTLPQKLYLEQQILAVENGPNFRKTPEEGKANQ